MGCSLFCLLLLLEKLLITFWLESILVGVKEHYSNDESQLGHCMFDVANKICTLRANPSQVVTTNLCIDSAYSKTCLVAQTFMSLING
jgi:hypothetical protein